MHLINKGSFISARVLLNVINELGKSDEMRGFRTFYLFFAFNKFNSTKARMFDSIYHMALRLL